MYSDPHLDTPPPQSQFRRPWSPEPYDSLRPTQDSWNRNQGQESRFLNQNHTGDNRDYQPDYGYGFDYPYARRREPSDVSVEALDLADYAVTLRAHQTHASPYQGQSSRDILYPPSPPAQRPFANRTPSRDTLSSNTNSSPAGGRRTTRRPFSLPPPSVQSYASRHTHASSPRSANSHNYPSLHNTGSSSKLPGPATETEFDIGHFPAWSRSWYNKPKAAAGSAGDIYTALPPSSWSPKRPYMDPNGMFRPDTFPQSSDPYDPYSHHASSIGHDSSRDLLPWSSEPPEYPIDESLKEERIRMLEREFGSNVKGKAPADNAFVDEDGKPLVGTVDPKGRLVTSGPKKRIALRVLQIILSLFAAIPAIYAAAFIKAVGKPPPSGSIAAYVLYIFACLTIVLLFYLFVFRPCCCAGKRRKPGPGGNALANGMMVLPVSGLPGGKKKNKAGGKKGKKGQPGMPGDVQVNLIVDPNAFGGRRDEDEDDTEDEDDDESGSVPGAFVDPASARRKRRRAKRRSVFVGLAMEEDWKRARSWLKKITAIDVFMLILWGAIFILIMIGKRCPSGSFQGWCNAYNVSSAAACLLAFSFGVGIIFDVQDLSSSKVSPRTRA